MNSTTLDKRLFAYREDLADIRLEGQVVAEKYVEGREGYIGHHPAPIYNTPEKNSGVNTTFLPLQKVKIFEQGEDYVWVQSEYDEYVGYVESQFLHQGELASPTHRLITPLSPIYQKADIKSPTLGSLCMGSEFAASIDQDQRFLRLSTGGYVYLSHAQCLDKEEIISKNDVVALVREFLSVPYLWGGNTSFGIDCSGLVQSVFHTAGIFLPRDTDLMIDYLKDVPKININAVDKGDLIFWKGHVAMATSTTHMIHANGHHMLVVEEKIVPAIERIKNEWGDVEFCIKLHDILKLKPSTRNVNILKKLEFTNFENT